MAKLINPGFQPVNLPTGHVVPRKGELVTTNDVLRCVDNARVLAGLIATGAVLAEYDPDPIEPKDEVSASIIAAPAVAEQPTETAPMPRKSKG